jgi:hypothetical protein
MDEKFSNLLNKCALGIIVFAIVVLLSTLFNFSCNNLNNKKSETISFQLDKIKLQKFDSTIINLNARFIKDFNLKMD